MDLKIALKTAIAAIITILGLSACAGTDQSVGVSNPQTPQPEPKILLVAANTSEAPLTDQDLLGDDLGWNEPQTVYTVPDPLEPVNRMFFVFNDRLYFWVLKPTAQGYRAVVPSPARVGVQNFFFNITAPIRIVNNILQGRGEAAEAEWARFLYNSTVGVLGFGNPAKSNPALNPPLEDFGLTLGTWGLGDGFYLVLPALGPSTLRDSVGKFGDYWLNPVNYVGPNLYFMGRGRARHYQLYLFHIGDYESLKKAALDPYQAFRDAYIQLRQSKLRHN